MDDFRPVGSNGLTGHLRAVELLGPLTARAGALKRYVRTYVCILFLFMIHRVGEVSYFWFDFTSEARE
jgi:hypothetical protein